MQTNHVQRALGLRLGLHLVARRAGRQPVHVLEVGTSAGLVLRQGAYGYRLGDGSFGDPTSPVQLTAESRSDVAVLDLYDVPFIASLTGIDLNPLDPGCDADRRWLAALVWPENRAQAQLLQTALALAERTPVTVLSGDAVDCCPAWPSPPSPPARPACTCRSSNATTLTRQSMHMAVPARATGSRSRATV